jgi:magnesium chelatase family protein
MLARLHSVTLEGIEGVLCEVEVDVARRSLEKPIIVGLPDPAVKESAERVRSAITNCGYDYPKTQSIVNLAPADVKKAGPAFDLPIALGMLIGEGALAGLAIKDYVIVGELALDGRVRPVNGVLSMAMTAAGNGFRRMIVPLENAKEAAVVQEIEVFGVGSLAQAVGFLSEQLPLDATITDIDDLFGRASHYEVDFSDVKGQETVKRALTVAAAGAHNIMMIGPPGSGKTMLAQRLATILPALSLAESLETTRVYSAVGLLDKDQALLATRPVRAPHHSASGPALIGGGSSPHPGELSLAHHGILFLDEFVEFQRHVLEMIRQPLEDGHVMVSRAKKTMRFPAEFMLVAAMNPCPCGYFGSTLRACKCTPTQITKYMAKVSGPLVDRIDIHIDVPAVAFGKLRSRDQQVSSQTLRDAVSAARDRQARRFGQGQLMTNSRMSHRQLEAFCKIDSTGEMMLKHAMMELGLSARAHDKICKVARTIADLEGSDDIQADHVAEAIGYRKLDRKL